MNLYLIIAGFFLAYVLCLAGALLLAQKNTKTTDRAILQGTSGEQRVAQALAKAGYAVITDLTVKYGVGTHQIDHVVCGQNTLFVIETKTWSGTIEGRAGDQSWKLYRPRGRGKFETYNPLRQNQTHAEVISAITRVPVIPLVVSAGFVRVPDDLGSRVLSLAGLPAVLGPPGPPTGRIESAFAGLARRKASWGQKSLSSRHRQWMAHGRRFNPVRALWVASAISLVCALWTAERLFTG
jgi:Nuclease-related domain